MKNALDLSETMHCALTVALEGLNKRYRSCYGNVSDSPQRRRSQIVQSYSPGGANTYPHLVRGSFDPLEFDI